MTRKEMIPAPVRHEKSYGTFCKPEWDLLCRIRSKIRNITQKDTKSQIFGVLKDILDDMNETFDDWSEDPK